MAIPRHLLRNLLLACLAVAVLATWGAGVYAQQGNDDEKLQLGAQLYQQNCAVCHGPNGEGRVGAVLSKNWPSIRPDLVVRATIENGVPGSPMPAWSLKNGGPLTDEQIEALMLYILSWQTGGLELLTPFPTTTSRPPITPVPQVAGDPNRGAALYDQNCAMCHGPEGEGRIGATLAKDWPAIRPDLRIQSTIANGVSGSVMPAWSQANGGPLAEQEINDLVAFILTWEAAASLFPPSPTPAVAEGGGLGELGGVLLTVVIFALVVGTICS
jgi:mono/diheme cytochrome c family protein